MFVIQKCFKTIIHKVLRITVALENIHNLTNFKWNFVQSEQIWKYLYSCFVMCIIKHVPVKGEKELWKCSKWLELLLLLPWMEICWIISWFWSKLRAKSIILGLIFSLIMIQRGMSQIYWKKRCFSGHTLILNEKFFLFPKFWS